MKVNPTAVLKSIILAAAGVLVVFSTNAQPGRTKVSLQKNSELSTIITIDISSPTQVNVSTPRGEASIYFVEGAVNTLEMGSPIMPKITRSIIIPNGSDAHLRIVASKFKDIENVTIAPSKGNLSRDIDPARVPFTYGSAYLKDQFFPNAAAELSKSYTLRQYEGVPINVYPLQYNPVSKKLRIYTSVTVEVSYTKSGIVKSPAQLPIRDEGFSEVYKSQFLNYSSQSLRYTPLSDEGSMLIVCHPAFMAAMQPFVDWKNQRGVKTVMVDYTQVASSAATLKTYISNYYHQNGLTFVLLVGDAAQVPANSIPQTSSTGNGDSDSFYGFIDGDDSYPEVIVGRFSAETVAHATTMVNRSILYEKKLDENASWIATAMGIASDQGGGSQGDNGESDKVHMDNIRAKLSAYGYTSVSQIYDPGASAATVSEQINSGVGLIDYVGHGADTYWVTTSFGVSNTNTLTNSDRWPFIFDVACVNGNFVPKLCFAEAFTRASNANGPTGTVDIVASTINQSWDPPMAGQDNMVSILTESDQNNIRRTFGGIVANGCMGMNDKYGKDGDEMTQFWTIFGDPSLLVRTKQPVVNTVSHQGVLVLGQSNLDVSCSASDATVTLWQKGTILASTKTVNGAAALSFNSISTQDSVLLTVTGFNLKTVVDTIPVIVADKPYLIVSSITPVGSLNTLAEDNLNLTLKNLSSVPTAVTNVLVKLRCQDTRITMVDSTENITSIGLDPITLASAFKIYVKSALPDLSTIKFTALISGKIGVDDYSNTATFTMVVTKPSIKITSVTVDDKLGNGNGNVEPGEFGTLDITIRNVGHAPALVPALNLNSTDLRQLEILASTINLETLNPDESKLISVQYSSPSSATYGQKVYLKATAVCSNGLQIADSSAFTLGASNYIIMQNGIVNACGKKFFDTGGPDNNYKSSESYTLTISAGDISSRVKLKFNSFENTTSDNLVIYDGPNVLSTILGSYIGSKTPFEVVSSSSYITLKFTSGSSTSGKGWDADILCVAPVSAPACPTIISPVNGATNQRIPQLSWTGKNADEYTVFFGLEATPALYARTTENLLSIPFKQNTTYYWQVNSKNQAGESSGCPINSFSTSASPDSITMRNGSTITCNGRFFDRGGPSADYTNSTRETFTIFPAEPGAMLTADFTQLVLELQYDTLYVWDGPDDRSTLIGAFNTATVPTKLQNLVANNPSGALTFQLFADDYVTAAGWIANIGCALPGNTSEVTLTVTDGTNPIEGATLTVGKGVYHTNASGVVLLTLPYGTYDFVVEKDEYTATTTSVGVAAPTTLKSIALAMKRTLNVTVVSSESGAQLYPASVIVSGVTYITNNRGVAIAEIGDATSVNWSVTANGFIGKEGVVSTPLVNNSVTVTINELQHIKVLLVDALTEYPLSNGTVTAGPMQSVTATDGYAHFIGAAGVYTVSASATGYASKPAQDLTLSSSTSSIIALMPNQQNVTIWVKDSRSNSGVANATVTINSTTYSTDSEGKVVVSLYPGSYTYTVSVANFNNYEGSFDVATTAVTVTAMLVVNGVDSEVLANFNIYPVPASGNITVEWGSQLKGTFTLTNITGVFVLRKEIANGDKIDISSLSSGVYLAHLVVDGKSKTVKLIVQ